MTTKNAWLFYKIPDENDKILVQFLPFSDMRLVKFLWQCQFELRYWKNYIGYSVH